MLSSFSPAASPPSSTPSSVINFLLSQGQKQQQAQMPVHTTMVTTGTAANGTLLVPIKNNRANDFLLGIRFISLLSGVYLMKFLNRFMLYWNFKCIFISSIQYSVCFKSKEVCELTFLIGFLLFLLAYWHSS